jgi:hypothetical protein
MEEPSPRLFGPDDILSLWMELVLDIEGPTSRLVSKDLAGKYGGFSLPRGTKIPRKPCAP